jgi:hypothetical protein
LEVDQWLNRSFQGLSSAPKLRREVGLVGLVFASLGSIIGAGWLFAALYAPSPTRRALRTPPVEAIGMRE